MIGVIISYFINLPHRLIAAIMGFGGGVLISVLAFELIEEAYIHGGLVASVAETMIPEPFAEAQSFIGLIIATGFLIFFLLTKTGG